MSFTNEPPQRPPPLPRPAPRRRRRWLRWLLVGFLGCVLVAALTYGHYRHRWAEELRATVADLDRSEPGWCLADLEAARAVVPDAENSAPVVSTACASLPRGWPPATLGDGLTGLPPQMQLAEVDATSLRDEIEQRQTSIRTARQLANLPNGRHPITYKREFLNTLLTHVDPTRKLFFLLKLDVYVQAQDGDLKGALRSCRALLNTARSLGDEPMMITQLVRAIGVGVTCQAVERVVAQGEPESDDLLAMQKLLEIEERFPRLLVGLRGERAGMHELLNALEAGDTTLDAVNGVPGSWPDAFTGIVERDYIRRQHPSSLAALNEIVRIAALPPHERDAPLLALDQKLRRERDILVGMLLPAIEKVDDLGARRTDGQLRCLIAALAAERYRQRHGQFPDTLEQLVPNFLPAVPLDPQDGQPLRYQALADRVVIYSLYPVRVQSSERRVSYDPDEPSPPGVGVAVHLFDVKHRRQPFVEILPPPTPDDDDERTVP